MSDAPEPVAPVERLVAALAAQLDGLAPEDVPDGVTVEIRWLDLVGDIEQASSLLRAAMSQTLSFRNGGCLLIGSFEIGADGVARIFIPPGAVVPLREVASRQAVGRLFAYGEQFIKPGKRDAP